MKKEAHREADVTQAGQGAPQPSAQGFGFTLALLGVFLAVTVGTQLPAGVAPSWLGQYRATFRTMWPQGWSFFSNTADTDTVTAFRMNPVGTVSGSALVVSMSSANEWGLGRTSQAENQEAGYLAAHVPDRYWIPCGDPLSSSCLKQANAYHFPARIFQPPLLCGSLVLVRSKPQSAPEDRPAHDHQAAAVAVVHLDCAQ